MGTTSDLITLEYIAKIRTPGLKAEGDAVSVQATGFRIEAYRRGW